MTFYFLILASIGLVSKLTVSSTNHTCLLTLDQSTISGRRSSITYTNVTVLVQPGAEHKFWVFGATKINNLATRFNAKKY